MFIKTICSSNNTVIPFKFKAELKKAA